MILGLATAVVSLSQALLVASSAATRENDDDDDRQNGVSLVRNNGLLPPDDRDRSRKLIERMLHSSRPLPLMHRHIQRRVRRAGRFSAPIHHSFSRDEDDELIDEAPDAGILSTTIQGEGESYAAGIHEKLRGLDETSGCPGFPQDLCRKCQLGPESGPYFYLHYMLDPRDEKCREATIDFCARGDFSGIVEYYERYHQGHPTDPCSLTIFDRAVLSSMTAWYCDYHLCYAKQHETMLAGPSGFSNNNEACYDVLSVSYCTRMKQACKLQDASVGSCAFDQPPSYYCDSYTNYYYDCPELPAGYSLAASSTDISHSLDHRLGLGTAAIAVAATAIVGGHCLL